DRAALLCRLTAHEVQYVLIAGLAMLAQGSAYVAENLDICYSRTSQNLAALASAFAGLHTYLRGVPPRLPFRLDVPSPQAGLIFILRHARGDIDLQGSVSGIGDLDRFPAQSERHEMCGGLVRVLSIEGLIAAKKAAGRSKDKLRLLELEELKKMRDAAQEGTE